MLMPHARELTRSGGVWRAPAAGLRNVTPLARKLSSISLQWGVTRDSVQCWCCAWQKRGSAKLSPPAEARCSGMGHGGTAAALRPLLVSVLIGRVDADARRDERARAEGFEEGRAAAAEAKSADALRFRAVLDPSLVRSKQDVLTRCVEREGNAITERLVDARPEPRWRGAAPDRRRRLSTTGVRLSVCEVYNETVVDLLRPPPEKGQPVGLPVVERNGLTEIKGLEKAPVASAADALQLLYDAEINRAVASHAMNCASSRSHLVVTGHVVCSHGEDITEAKLTIVDLAGAERVNQTQSRDGTATLREAGYINKSLAFLEQVVVALGDDKPRLHIPYRSSKLTHALKDALGGTCRTTLIACVWQSAAQADQARAASFFCRPYTNARVSTLRAQ